MSIAKLIQEFDVRKIVPVDVNDVVAALGAHGSKDEIYFFPVDIDSDILRGQLVHWDRNEDFEYPTDPSQKLMKSVACIYYARSMTDDWQRLVTCKETLHILDAEGARASSVDVVFKLTEKIVLAPEFQNITDGSATLSDRAAMAQAVAVLFPWRARELIMADGSLTIAEIAKLVDLPIRYVALVMSETWDSLHDILLSIKD